MSSASSNGDSFILLRRALDRSEAICLVDLTAAVRTQRRLWRWQIFLPPAEAGEIVTESEERRALFLSGAAQLLETAVLVEQAQRLEVDTVLSGAELRAQASILVDLATRIADLEVAHPRSPPRGYWIRRFLSDNSWHHLDEPRGGASGSLE